MFVPVTIVSLFFSFSTIISQNSHSMTACDVLARYMRLSGREVFFLSGTDEHGQKVEQSAAKANVHPLAFVDVVSVNFQDLLAVLNISNDKFIRTTQDYHKKAVQVCIENVGW
jgi:methionyl-tRNA synthetase